MTSEIFPSDLFGNLNFKQIIQNPDFKEDSVREVILLPIFKALGYTQENIVRSKNIKASLFENWKQKATGKFSAGLCFKS